MKRFVLRSYLRCFVPLALGVPLQLLLLMPAVESTIDSVDIVFLRLSADTDALMLLLAAFCSSDAFSVAAAVAVVDAASPLAAVAATALLMYVEFVTLDLIGWFAGSMAGASGAARVVAIDEEEEEAAATDVLIQSARDQHWLVEHTACALVCDATS